MPSSSCARSAAVNFAKALTLSRDESNRCRLHATGCATAGHIQSNHGTAHGWWEVAWRKGRAQGWVGRNGHVMGGWVGRNGHVTGGWVGRNGAHWAESSRVNSTCPRRGAAMGNGTSFIGCIGRESGGRYIAAICCINSSE